MRLRLEPEDIDWRVGTMPPNDGLPAPKLYIRDSGR